MFEKTKQNLIVKPNKIPTYKIRTKEEKIFIWFCGDLHYGNENFNQELFDKYLNWAKRKDNVFTILMGDMIEMATSDSYHAKMIYNQKVNPQEQLETVIKMLKPLKGRIICCINGNHEDRASELTGLDVTKMMAKEFDCTYIPNGGYIILNVNGIEYKFAIFHGSAGSVKPFTQLEKADQVWSGVDILALGHVHQMAVGEKSNYVVENGETVKKTTYLIRTGAFLNYPGYAQKRFFPIATLGSSIAILYTNRKVVSVNISGYVAK